MGFSEPSVRIIKIGENKFLSKGCLVRVSIPSEFKLKVNQYIFGDGIDMKNFRLGFAKLIPFLVSATIGAQNVDWPSYGGDNGSSKYSALNQINSIQFR